MRSNQNSDENKKKDLEKYLKENKIGEYVKIGECVKFVSIKEKSENK